MFTVNLKGTPDAERPDFVKISLVIYKTGYTRVYKTLPITGLWANWDQATQRFIPKTSDAHTNNSLLSDTLSKYIQQANLYERQGKNWTPKELKAEFSKTRQELLTEVIPTVEQMFHTRIAELRSQKRIKNGHILSRNTYAHDHEKTLEHLKQFTKDVYNKSFTNFRFTDIDEKFLTDYVFYIEEEALKKGTKGRTLRNKLNILYKIVEKAQKRGISGANLEHFTCTNEKFRVQDSVSRAVDLSVIRALENLDQSLFSETELFYIDMFLFCFYCGGMAPIDAAYLTWSCIDVEKHKMCFERIKYPKKARPPFLPRAQKIAEKYRSKCCGDYVLPLFPKTNMTETQIRSRMNYLCLQVNQALRRALEVVGIKEDICWYSARGTYITMMLERKYDAGIVAEHCGNSVLTIYKNYFKNLREEDIIEELCKEFAA